MTTYTFMGNSTLHCVENKDPSLDLSLLLLLEATQQLGKPFQKLMKTHTHTHTHTHFHGKTYVALHSEQGSKYGSFLATSARSKTPAGKVIPKNC
mmetsp:Transcript_87266/g.173217  ORF Transcript_87266/g.173217 Transcript_87266/m.173217 type:complete len:95 (+) Transcript_87266:250-534(+)